MRTARAGLTPGALSKAGLTGIIAAFRAVVPGPVSNLVPTSMADISDRLAAIAPRLRSGPLYEPCQAVVSDNPPWDSATARYLIVRLSPLRDTASASGHFFLHHLLRQNLGPDVFIDFSFFPGRQDRSHLRAAGLVSMFGIFSRRGAADFSAILVSCSYAPELVNLPVMLLDSGIPVRSGARKAGRPHGGHWPLIIMGGSNALASQAAVFDDGDSFVDGIFFGEGEDGGQALVRAIHESDGLSPDIRAARLVAACQSFWPAGSHSGPPVTVARCKAADAPLVDCHPVLNGPGAGTVRIQLSRGCPSTCTFCFEGWEHKPYREVPVNQILDVARRLVMATGADTVELYSFNFNAHSDIGAIVFGLNRIFENVTMTSQRADLLLFTPRMIDLELAAGKTSFSIGVEGISDGMRAFYSKGLSTSVLQRLLERLAREKVREIKLFFIIAGIEDADDIVAFQALCRFIAGLREKNDRGLRVLFSFGYLVRMPFVPLRDMPLALDRRRMEGLAANLKGIVETAGFEFRLAGEWDEYVADQLMVAGPFGMAQVLVDAAADGIVFDGTLDSSLRVRLEDWLRKQKMLEPDGRSGRICDTRSAGWQHAFSFLQTAAAVDYLDSRALLASRRVEGGSCMSGLEIAGPDARCLGCGACRTAAESDALTGHSIAPIDATMVSRVAELVKAKRRMRPRYVKAIIPGIMTGAAPEFMDAWLCRGVLSRCPGLVGRLFAVREALWSLPQLHDRFVPGMTGQTVIALYGLDLVEGGQPPRLSDASLELAVAAMASMTNAQVDVIDGDDVPGLEGLELTMTFPCEMDAAQLLARVRDWLSGLRMNFVERRHEDGRLFQVAPKDARKRIVTSAQVWPESRRVVVFGGARLDMAGLFPRPGDRAGVAIDVTGLKLA